MTQTFPLPITAAMLAKANAANEAKPRYHGAGVAGDWAGGVVGNDVNAATAAVAVAGAATSNFVLPDYAPRTQTAKGAGMAPARTVLADTGIDYGIYTGLEGRDGTIQPRQAYPVQASAPVWVPANAKIHIDFLGGSPQGRAWSNGAEVGVGTLIGNDPNADELWDTTQPYDPLNLSVNGYQSAVVAFIGAARTRLLQGATFTLQFYEKTTPGNLSVTCSSTDGNAQIIINANMASGRTVNATSRSTLNLTTTVDLVYASGGCTNRFAATLVANRLDLACNGHAAVTAPLTTPDRPPANPFTTAFWDGPPWFQSITIYDPLPTTAGLSALSVVS